MAGDGDISDLRTVRDFLRWAVSRFNAAGLSYGHGTDNAFDEAAFIILETLQLPIDRLDPFLDARLTTPERAAVADIVESRVTTRKPASYLTGTAYIHGLRFRVDERALVPRSFIGELLADGALLDGAMNLIPDPTSIGRVLDVGTGSGCLAILAAYAFPSAEVDAVDISRPALDLAALNVADHGMERRISLIESDLLAALPGRTYDLVIANPPYVDAEAIAALPAEFRHEPVGALAAGNDGLDVVRRLLADVGGHLSADGGLLCEVGTGRERLEEAFPDLPFLWLDTAESSGEVFWLTAEAFR
ncbi:MAG: 50S ribosomal protein L3 N(5)-glutamine methyltransferase [Bauldia sp.]